MTEEEMGPVDYLVLEFPGNKMTGEGFPLLLDLVDRGIIRILDFLFVQKQTDGSISSLSISDLDGDGAGTFSMFAGASSGLLDEGDVADAASVIEPGSSAGIIIFENSWAAPFVAAVRAGGAQVAASGRIPHEALLSTLDLAEAGRK